MKTNNNYDIILHQDSEIRIVLSRQCGNTMVWKEFYENGEMSFGEIVYDTNEPRKYNPNDVEYYKNYTHILPS